jgi:hypothetical protein
MKESPVKKRQRKDGRTEFYCDLVTTLDCMSGNFERSNGKPAMSITLGLNDGSIQKIAFDLNNARKLILGLLIGTAKMDDPFAHRILNDMFPLKDGEFVWPDHLVD